VDRSVRFGHPDLVGGRHPPQEVPEADRVGKLWSELLGRSEPPAAEEDFFAEGGDSLAAVRLLTRLRQDIDVAVAPRDFLADPTFAGLLARVAATETADAAVSSGPVDVVDAVEQGAVALADLRPSLVELRGGTGRPVFLLHPSGGDVLCYVELARRLGTDRPVYAISDPALDGADPFADIPAMAEAYRALVVDRDPEGPWTIDSR
jgi:acyl carrier protein